MGLHFFLSYTMEDTPSEAVMDEIARKLCEHPLLRDHAAFGAHHYDKAHRHTHFFVSNFSATGKAKKLCMRYEDYNGLRKHANRLCVAHGLSVIDLPTLCYKDPEYSAWIDGVIAGGQITVHPEREEHRGASTKQIYFRQMREKEEAILAEEKLLTAAQLKKKKNRENYCWNFENDPDKPGYPMTGPDGKHRGYHAVRLYDDKGRKRSLVELIGLLLVSIYQYEKIKNTPRPEPQRRSIRMATDYKLQRMVDAVRVARELNVRGEAEVRGCIADTGKQMNALRREKSRHENSILRHEEILSAWDTYRNADPTEMTEAFRQAYAILSRNRVLTEEAAEAMRQRYLFEQQKISDYDKRIPELNRRYRNLKKLEQMIACPEWEVRQIKKQFADNQAKEESLEEKIHAAQMQKSAPKDAKNAERHR